MFNQSRNMKIAMTAKLTFRIVKCNWCFDIVQIVLWWRCLVVMNQIISFAMIVLLEFTGFYQLSKMRNLFRCDTIRKTRKNHRNSRLKENFG